MNSATVPAVEPGDLAVAVRVGQKMLARYGTVDSGDIFAYAQAHGGLTEALRILLRAVGAEPVAAPEPLYGGDVDQFISDAYDSLADSDLGDEPEIADSGKISTTARRCPAAHPEDPTPCGGPVTVTVLDADSAGADGCEHHGARLLASLDRGRVYALPDAPEGAAIRVFKAADTIRPFPWVNGPRTRDEQLSRAETRGRGERP